MTDAFRMRRLKWLVLVSCIGLSSCSWLQSNATESIHWVNHLLLGSSELAPSATPKPLPVDSDPIARAAANAKANAEILREMLEVVFMEPPKNRSEFGNWADTLNQGASIEGVYNGLVHSLDYKNLETKTKGASADALKVFTEELALLEMELPTPTQFDWATASPLPSDSPVAAPVDGMNTIGMASSSVPDSKVNSEPTPSASSSPSPEVLQKALEDQYLKVFVGASIFTLKRVLCDEAMKVIASKNQYREKLGIWYSKWVGHMAQYHIDFGIGLRNQSDEDFHYQWAMKTSDDRIIWEVLNRLHRLLNEFNSVVH